MRTSPHPMDPKAIYREIANDAEPRAYARPGEMATRKRDEMRAEDLLEGALITALALVAGIGSLVFAVKLWNLS